MTQSEYSELATLIKRTTSDTVFSGKLSQALLNQLGQFSDIPIATTGGLLEKLFNQLSARPDS